MHCSSSRVYNLFNHSETVTESQVVAMLLDYTICSSRHIKVNYEKCPHLRRKESNIYGVPTDKNLYEKNVTREYKDL